MTTLLDLLVVPEGARATGAAHDRLRISNLALAGVVREASVVPLLVEHQGGPIGTVGRFRYEPGLGLCATAFIEDEVADELDLDAAKGVSLAYSMGRTRLDSSGNTVVTGLSVTEVSLTPRPSFTRARVLRSRRVASGSHMAMKEREAMASGFSAARCAVNTGKPCRTCSTAKRVVTHHVSAWALEPV